MAQTNSGLKLFVSPTGNDSNSGTQTAPLRTITRAVSVVKSQPGRGGEILLLPGVYRENVDIIDVSAPDNNPLIIQAANGPGTAFVLGSASSKSENWTWVQSDDGEPLPAAARGKVFYAQLGNLTEQPEIAAITDSNNQVLHRLFKAREPDVDPFAGTVQNDPRWVAEGRAGSSDYNSLVDTTDDTGREAGNIKSINGFTDGFLVGARIDVKDGYSGHDANSSIITSHNPSTGTVVFSRRMSYFTSEPMVNAGSTYFVEGKAQLLDVPGEWYYNSTKQRLYVIPPTGLNLASANLELAVRRKGFVIQNSTNVYVRNVSIQFINYPYNRNVGDDGAVAINNSSASQSTKNILIEGLNIQHVGIGVRLYQANGQGKTTTNISLRNNKIAYTHGFAMVGFQFPHRDSANNYIKGLFRVFLHGNEISYGNYRPTGDGGSNGNMVWLQYLSDLVLTNNRFHHGAHNGIEIHSPGELNLLAQNNIFEYNCFSSSDCGGFKVFAGNYSAKNVLVMGNISRNNYGCSYVSVVNNKWVTSDRVGCAASGFYSDIVRADDPSLPSVTYFRNLSYANYQSGILLTRSEKHRLLGNVVINNPIGIRFSTGSGSTENHNGTQIRGNVIVRDNNRNTSTKDHGLDLPLDQANMSVISVDSNVYRMTGDSAFNVFVRPLTSFSGTRMKTIADVQAQSPWEDAGKDTTASIPVPTGDLVGVTQILQTAGASTAVPADVQNLISTMNTKLGISTAVPTSVGIDPTLSVPQPFTPQLPAQCLADINQDKVVDIQDYSILAANFFRLPPTNPLADINGDGIVDISDYNVLVGGYFGLQCAGVAIL